MGWAGLRRCHNPEGLYHRQAFYKLLIQTLNYKDEILLVPQQSDLNSKSFGMSAEGSTSVVFRDHWCNMSTMHLTDYTMLRSHCRDSLNVTFVRR